MGDHEDLPEPNGLMPNGLRPSEASTVSKILDAERWSLAEERTSELIKRIQPNKPSEDRRIAVANYVQGLIKKCFPCQVFTFGSVPLKTYLPDGDIDLTAFSKNLDLKDTWANEVREVLENEEKSLDAEFRVKEVQYIKAEVKIIKCLVENIVVDISFNQLGGLCTLCFLEEIDNLINQDHLFKRSIILIKAWCYYESRILGAHHGLLSTYALETLVLYIFHVFNNSFAGPLEVLYRFLEFFSKFDWENFCVSLWGPVPISSLPDTTAEPPRKDSGDLLLSRIFLDACSAVYAVFPSGHDTQGPPFVSKHFNVIDPLRTNNNLGRSVSKGNFYRIRSAFSFGAKRLAGLLECPKEDITAEVDKFFTNTWRRHGSGNRPDAAALVSLQSQESKSHSNHDLVSCRNQDNIRQKFDNVGLQPTQQLPSEVLTTSSVIENFSQQVSTANQFHPSIGRTAPSGSLSQKSYSSQGNYRTLDQVVRNTKSTETVRIERLKSHSKHVISNDYTGQGKLQFARTHSSPELSDASEEILSHSKRTIMPDFAKNHFMSGKSNANFRKIRGQDARFVNDSMSPKYNSPNEDRATIADSNCMPDDFPDDTSMSNTGEELASVSQSLDTHQEEQDSVNMMALPRMNGLIQPLQLPINFTTHQFPVPSHFFPPINYSPKNIGMIPATVPISLWPPQFPQGFAAPSLSSYLSTHQLETNGEEAIESVNDTSSLTEMNQDDASDHAFWPEQENISSLGFIPRDSSYQVFNSNEKKEPFGGLSFIPFPHVGTPNVLLMRDDARVSTEGLNMERTSHDEQILHQNNKENDVYSSNKSADTRSLHSSRGSSSRSTLADTWDGSAKATKLPRDRWGRKPVASSTSATSYGNSRSWRNYEDRDDHSSEWSKQSSSGSEIAEQTDSLSTASGSHQSSCPDPALASGSDSVFPVAPMFVFASHRQRSGSGTGSVFYPTGPPVPYYMLPTLPSGSGSSDGVLDQVNRLDINQLNPLARDLDSSEKSLQIEESTSTTTMDGIPSGSSVERKSDILNGDFPSHWLNLQYGRLCQDPNVPGPPVYPAPVIVPSMHFQGHYPCDAHGRPYVANANPFPIMNCGPRILLPLQPGSVRHGELFQHYGDEVPSFRGGTGTFLPKQKAPPRDRQPNTRNHRTNYNHDHNGQGDREGSWINAKSRAANRSHGRVQHDRPNARPDRLPAIDNRAERSWESHKNERVSNYQNSSLSSTSANHGIPNMTYGMYPLTSINSDNTNPSGSSFPSFVMLYPYHHPGVGYVSSSEQDELGSLSSMQIPGANEAQPSCNGGVMRNAFEPVHETYQQGSDCSSPDQPSSPHIRR